MIKKSNLLWDDQYVLGNKFHEKNLMEKSNRRKIFWSERLLLTIPCF